MLTLPYLARYDVIPSRLWEGAVAGLFCRYEDVTGTRLALHGFTPPARPVLYATNSTQKYDFMTFRSAMRRNGQSLVTVTKAKNYHSPVMRPVLERTGVIPLASRGYVILVDARAVFGREASDEEYRAMRDHLDRGVDLPAGPHFDALRARPRDILGVAFDPRAETLRDAWRKGYSKLLGEALRFARASIAAGYSVQIYPEGTVSSRLGKGRIGAMVFARALGVEVVPVGMSGCRDVFVGPSLRLRGGVVDLRFGAPYEPDFTGLAEDFAPFDPDHEDRGRPALQRATDDLMDRIDALLSPACRRQEGFTPDGTRGTRRFL